MHKARGVSAGPPANDGSGGTDAGATRSGVTADALRLRAIAEDALVASEARLREALGEAEAALAKTNALYRVSTSQAAGESLQTVLQHIVDAVAETLPAYRVHLFAVDSDRRRVTGNVRGGPGGGPEADIDYEELMEGLAGWVLTHREATISPGGVRDPRESDRVHARRLSIGHRSMIAAPILYQDKALGIVVANNSIGEPEYEQSDVDLLWAMARQCAISIENASIRDELQRARDELEDRVAQRTAELAASEERYRRITETITDYVYRVTAKADGVFETHHGPGCVAVTGYSSDEFAARPNLWIEMVMPEDRDRVLAQASDLREKGTARPVEHRIVRKDGAVRYVRSTLVPQCGPDGTLSGYDGLLQDITLTHELEQQLVQAQKLQSIGRLAGGVAHDFNNLLTPILGNAELALMDLPPEHPAAESVREIALAAERAAAVTRQLLAFARKQIVQPVPLDISAVIAGSIPMLRRLLGEDVDVTADLQEGLGIVLADPGQIQQLLINLTVNGRDAMPEGGRLVVETSNVLVDERYRIMRPEVALGPYVRLTVTDTGSGMSDETMRHLFEPFFTTRTDGTGLGLATCHGIVTASGGHIWAHSEIGVGTTMTVLLPVAEGAARPVSEPRVALSSAVGSEAVLVVEDDASVRRLAVLGLRANGYTVFEASGAADALQLAATPARLDLLVSDVVMPGMRGPELAVRFRGLRPDAKVLLVSGHAETSEAFRNELGSVMELLPKPFTPERLARKVREVLDAG